MGGLTFKRPSEDAYYLKSKKPRVTYENVSPAAPVSDDITENMVPQEILDEFLYNPLN